MAPSLRKSFRLKKMQSLSSVNQRNENYFKKVNEGRINKVRASVRYKSQQKVGTRILLSFTGLTSHLVHEVALLQAPRSPPPHLLILTFFFVVVVPFFASITFLSAHTTPTHGL